MWILSKLMKGREFKTVEEVNDFHSLARNSGMVENFRPDEAEERAQLLAYEAFSKNGSERRNMAMRALEISENCPDAYVILAEMERDNNRKIEFYSKGVDTAERILGKEIFDREKGNFWGIIETRPYMRAQEGLAVACGCRLKRDHVAWRKHIQTLKEKIFAFIYAYKCSNAPCGRTYRSAEADLLSPPFWTYSLDVLAEIGFLGHEEKRSIPEVHESLSRKRIDISERECYDLVHSFEKLIATRPIELDPGFLEKAGENGGIVLAIDAVAYSYA